MTDETSAQLLSTVLERTVTIAGIPAPSGAEGKRADVVRVWWTQDGWDRVDIDPTGNVWALARDGVGGAIILSAHLDTVFADDVDHQVHSERGRLIGPGVGDDAIAVAALSAIGTLVGDVPGRPVWLLASVGEEGLGNLAGSAGCLDPSPRQPIGALIAVEGNYLGQCLPDGAGRCGGASPSAVPAGTHGRLPTSRARCTSSRRWSSISPRSVPMARERR